MGPLSFHLLHLALLPLFLWSAAVCRFEPLTCQKSTPGLRPPCSAASPAPNPRPGSHGWGCRWCWLVTNDLQSRNRGGFCSGVAPRCQRRDKWLPSHSVDVLLSLRSAQDPGPTGAALRLGFTRLESKAPRLLPHGMHAKASHLICSLAFHRKTKNQTCSRLYQSSC